MKARQPETDIRNIIQKSITSASGVICEDAAKTILKSAGLPVVEEIRVHTSKEAVAAARVIGYPVVIKGTGPLILHKTESGLVQTGLTGDAQVSSAVDHIRRQAGDSLEAILVQPQIRGKREFVAGMFRDPQFGPVIMFGLGGIHTEALNDISFKIAPLKDTDIEDMFDEIESKSLLGEFRGEKAVDKTALRRILKGISNLACQYPDIREMDINPLIITPKGDPVAVDALMITEPEKPVSDHKPRVDKAAIRSCFYPQSIAFIGASGTAGKWGHMLLTNTLSRNYTGKIFLVNPKAQIIAGRKVYTSVDDIDSDIDLAVVTVPADQVIDLIPGLKKKHTIGMLVITSGFRETGEAGVRLEKELTAAASAAGIVILGPNTMGICNPHIDFFCSGVHVYPRPGTTALVCQSGNMGTQLLAFAEQQDIGIRAFSGSGNEAMVTIEDYMELFEVDELTGIVVLYIESIKNGKRFLESAARVSGKKPVVVLKGGRTRKGTRAASSHTGALASNTRVFDAACRQAGIIQVAQPMELLDLSAVFSSLPLPRGNRVGILTLGGGWGVITTDLCEENQLEVPVLPESLVRELDGILPSYWSRGNPVDIVGERDPEIPLKSAEALLKWDECDAVIHLGIHGKRILANRMMDSILKTDPSYQPKDVDLYREVIDGFETEYIHRIIDLTRRYEKPVLGVSLLTDATTRTLYQKEGSQYKAVFFPSPERAVKALQGMVLYHKWLQKNNIKPPAFTA